MNGRTHTPYARGVSQLMYVGDSEPEINKLPRPRILDFVLGGIVAWLLLRRR